MNKKIISGVLACAMAMSSVFALTACNEPDPSGGTVVEPGTVITDEKTKSDIFGAITETELGGVTYSAGLNLSVTAGAKTQSQTLTLEGAALFDKAIKADVFGFINGSDGEQKVNQYLVLFLRDGASYLAMGDGLEDAASLKKQLKAEEEPIVLSKGEFAPAGYLDSPVAMKVLKNLTSLAEGVITKTEGGYSLEYDVFGAVGELISGAEGLITAIEANVNMTATAFFGQSFIKNTLQKLLKGVTAKELYELAAPILPDGVKEALPEASATTEAYAYLENLLRSGTFYTALTGGEEPWTEWQTFGAVPVKEFVSLLTGGEVDLGNLGLKDAVSGLGKNLETVLVSLLTRLMGLEGAVSNANVDLSVEFSFDDDKKLLGFSLDGLTEGTVTPETTAEPEGEQNGESGSQEEGVEDVQPTAAEGASTVRATLKMEATIVSSPELFGLAGCKYHGEDGTNTILK